MATANSGLNIGWAMHLGWMVHKVFYSSDIHLSLYFVHIPLVAIIIIAAFFYKSNYQITVTAADSTTENER